jgi:hypothetical protein
VGPRWQIGIAIEHPSGQTLGLLCEDHKAIGAVAESREKIPTADYYETVGRLIAAAFLPITPEEASSELLKCHNMALPKREWEWALTETTSPSRKHPLAFIGLMGSMMTAVLSAARVPICQRQSGKRPKMQERFQPRKPVPPQPCRGSKALISEDSQRQFRNPVSH